MSAGSDSEEELFSGPRVPTLLTLQDFRLSDHLLGHPSNTSAETDVCVLELSSQKRSWSSHVDSDSLRQRLVAFEHSPRQRGGEVFAVFVSLVDLVEGDKTRKLPTFDYRTSISKQDLEFLAEHTGLNPAFLPDFFGQYDYWAPRVFRECTKNRKKSYVDFCCQYSRFNVKANPSPCSVYLRYDVANGKSFYLIASSDQDTTQMILERDFSGEVAKLSSIPTDNPLLLLTRITQIVFEKSKSPLIHTRRQLYKQLGNLDRVFEGDTSSPEAREGLHQIAQDLYMMSDNADMLVACCDQSVELVQQLLRLREEIVVPGPVQIEWSTKTSVQAHDTLKYLLSSWKSERRFLESYLSRKTTAMSLTLALLQQSRIPSYSQPPEPAAALEPTEKLQVDKYGLALLGLLILYLVLSSYVVSSVFEDWRPAAVLWAIAILTTAYMYPDKKKLLGKERDIPAGSTSEPVLKES